MVIWWDEKYRYNITGWWLSHLALWKMSESVGMTFPMYMEIYGKSFNKFHGSSHHQPDDVPWKNRIFQSSDFPFNLQKIGHNWQKGFPILRGPSESPPQKTVSIFPYSNQLAPGKRWHFANWKDPAFCSWVNQRFRLGHGFNSYFVK